MAMTTHLEVQQREDIRRDLAKNEVCSSRSHGRKCVSWQEDPSKIQRGRKSGKWLKVEIIAVKGPMAVVSRATISQVNVSKLRRPLDTVDLEKLPDSRERTRPPVHLSAIVDRQGLLAAPADLRTMKAESFSARLLQGFWSKIKKKTQDGCDVSPTVATKTPSKKI